MLWNQTDDWGPVVCFSCLLFHWRRNLTSSQAEKTCKWGFVKSECSKEMKPHCSIISTQSAFVENVGKWETGMLFCQGAAQRLVWSHWMQSRHQGSKAIGAAVSMSYQRPPAAVPHWKTRSFSAWLCLIGWHGVGEELNSRRPSLAESDGADGQRGGKMIQTQGREYWETEISSLTEKEWERRRVWGGWYEDITWEKNKGSGWLKCKKKEELRKKGMQTDKR